MFVVICVLFILNVTRKTENGKAHDRSPGTTFKGQLHTNGVKREGHRNKVLYILYYKPKTSRTIFILRAQNYHWLPTK